MGQCEKNVSGDCRYLDQHRRVVIPAHILAEAEISTESTVFFEVQNGCIILKPVVGIAVRDHDNHGKIGKKGRWDGN